MGDGAGRRARVRRAGSRWRLLVHEWRGETRGYGTAHDLRSYPQDVVRPLGYSDAEYAEYAARVRARRDEAVTNGWSAEHDLSGTEFDELVVHHWLHVEQMDVGYWWMSVGGVTVHVRVDRDGRARHVTVHGPGDYDSPVPGCVYELAWSGPSGESGP